MANNNFLLIDSIHIRTVLITEIIQH